MVFVTILLVGLRNDAVRLLLEFAGLEHKGMLIARPFLVGGETEPGGSTILVNGFGVDDHIDGMTGGEVMVRIELHEEGASVVGPGIVAKTFEVVAEVPGNVGEGGEASDGVAEETALILTGGDGVNARIIHVENDGKMMTSRSRAKRSRIEAAPVGNVEARRIQVGMEKIMRIARGPSGKVHGEVVGLHDGLAVINVGAAGESDAKPIEFETV